MSVRVPDERLDELARLVEMRRPWPQHTPAITQIRDALVADLRDARADNQRLRDALTAMVEDYEASDPYPTSDAHPLYAARAALAEEPVPDLDAIRARAERLVTQWTAPAFGRTKFHDAAVAIAREDVPALLAEIERLRQKLEEAHRTKEPSP